MTLWIFSQRKGQTMIFEIIKQQLEAELAVNNLETEILLRSALSIPDHHDFVNTVKNKLFEGEQLHSRITYISSIIEKANQSLEEGKNDEPDKSVNN